MSTAQRRAETSPIQAGSGVGLDHDWRQALERALEPALAPLGREPPDLLLLFASDQFSASYPDLLAAALERSGAYHLAGCSASGVIGRDRELEGEPAIAALALQLPENAGVVVGRIGAENLRDLPPGPGGWAAFLGLEPEACTGWIVLADPYSVNAEALLAGLARDYPDVPIVGGLASAAPGTAQTFVFANGHVYDQGAALIGLSGAVALRTVVSQGAEPIGEPWTITAAQGHRILTIGNRPAYQVLVETLHRLTPEERRRAARNLLVGLAIDEYRDTFRRGDFLIRNLHGADPQSGVIAIGAHPRVGQTIQFQVRDARAADDELRHLLERTSAELGGPPAAALLFACNGRGAGLFGAPDHDARAARDLLGAPPLAGLFCNGEIGPVGGRAYLHGYTASFGLIVPQASGGRGPAGSLAEERYPFPPASRHLARRLLLDLPGAARRSVVGWRPRRSLRRASCRS